MNTLDKIIFYILFGIGSFLFGIGIGQIVVLFR